MTVCIAASMYFCTNVCVSALTYMCVSQLMRVYVHVYVFAYGKVLWPKKRMCDCIYVDVYLFESLHVCLPLWVSMCLCA